MIFQLRLRQFLSTMIIFYLAVGLVIFYGVDSRTARRNRLDSLKGWAAWPVQYLEQKVSMEARQVRYTRKYYHQLAAFLTAGKKTIEGVDLVTLSRAYAMIAFCDYYLGKYPQAAGLLEKAAALDSRQFWIRYNLGVVFFQMENYEKALAVFQGVMSLTEEDIVTGMTVDPFPLWSSKAAEGFQKVSTLKFYEMTMRSYKLAVLAHERMNNPLKAKELSLEKPVVGEKLFDLQVPPSLYFAYIGQEKNLIPRN